MTTLDETPGRTTDSPAVTAEASREDLLAGVAGASALAAGAIHLMVVPQHLIEAPIIGVLFLGLGLGQVALALALRTIRAARTRLAVIGVHLVVISLYVATRTVELPFMPPHDAGHEFPHLPVAGGVGNGIPIYPGARIEPVGPLDLICLVAELVLVGTVAALLPDRLRTRVTTVMAGLGVLGVVLVTAQGVL